MSRSGYSDDGDMWAMIRWRGAVNSALRGSRGQAFLRDLSDALDAMPDKRLTYGELVDQSGCYCALGVLGAARGIELTAIDTEDRQQLGSTFNIAEALAAEVMFENDEGPWHGYSATDEDRWSHMRRWVDENLRTGTSQ